MKPKRKKRKTITELFLEGRPIDSALCRAGREALRRHQAAGQPIVVDRNGRVAEASPEAILAARSKKRS